MNELDVLQAHDPAPGAMPVREKDSLLAAIATSPPPRRRRRLLALTLAGTAVTAGSGGLAYAVLAGQDPATALKVNCAVDITKAQFAKDPDFVFLADTTSGDPLADCAGTFASLGRPVPELKAYTNGSSYIWVVPADWPVPSSWRPLDREFRTDASRLLLKQRVDDPVDGPGAECRSTEAVREAIEHEIRQLGLTGWSIEPAPGGAPVADGKTACAFAWVDEGAAKAVLVQTGPPAPHEGDNPAYLQLFARLRSDIGERCLTLQEAKSAAARAVADTGVPATISTGAAGAASCTAVDVVPGGALTIRLS